MLIFLPLDSPIHTPTKKIQMLVVYVGGQGNEEDRKRKAVNIGCIIKVATEVIWQGCQQTIGLNFLPAFKMGL